MVRRPMRLREIQWILAAAIPKLKVEEGGTKGIAGRPYITIVDVPELREGIELLRAVGPFAEIVETIMRHDVFVPQYASVDIQEGQRAALTNPVAKLRKDAL